MSMCFKIIIIHKVFLDPQQEIFNTEPYQVYKHYLTLYNNLEGTSF